MWWNDFPVALARPLSHMVRLTQKRVHHAIKQPSDGFYAMSRAAILLSLIAQADVIIAMLKELTETEDRGDSHAVGPSGLQSAASAPEPAQAGDRFRCRRAAMDAPDRD